VQSIKGLLRSFAPDRRGTMAIVVALSTPVLFGGVGMTADVIQWVYMKRAMQRQADSGALAGAFALSQRRPVAESVTNDLARNANVALTEPAVIENAPTEGVAIGNMRAVRVALSTNVRLPFTGYLMGRSVTIPAEATAQVVAIGDYCVLALETESRTGITMNGNTTLDLGCGLMSNAPPADSVTAGGSSRINASPVSAVGGVPPSNNYQAGTELFPYAIPQFDPFAALPDPVVTSSSNGARVNSNQRRTLSPGNYAGMTLNGDVTLQPGIYYVDGGNFSVGSQARVSGDGVTIILTSATAGSDPGSIATVDMNGGATINLKATTTGTYAGILFYQDRRATDSATNKFNGNSQSRYQGAIYVPNQAVWWNGTTDMDIRCLQLVARRIDFTGNSVITNECPTDSGASAFKGAAVKLVG
jgi:Flp pilus assembly protein TadG